MFPELLQLLLQLHGRLLLQQFLDLDLLDRDLFALPLLHRPQLLEVGHDVLGLADQLHLALLQVHDRRALALPSVPELVPRLRPTPPSWPFAALRR